MRKLVLTALSMILTVGLTLAAAVTVVSFDGKELKVKDGDKEVTYKVTDKTVIKAGDKEVPADKAAKMIKAGGKVEVTADKDTATQISIVGGKKKDK